MAAEEYQRAAQQAARAENTTSDSLASDGANGTQKSLPTSLKGATKSFGSRKTTFQSFVDGHTA